MAGQHRFAQKGDQGVRLLGMTGPVFLQGLLRPVVHAFGQAHEHPGEVVERLGRLPAQQGRDQGKPLGLDHAAEVGGVQALGLGRELAHLLVRDAGERTLDVLGMQPVPVGQELAHPAWARPQWFRLHLVPCRTGAILRHQEQRLEAVADLGRHRRGHLSVVAAVDEARAVRAIFSSVPKAGSS